MGASQERPLSRRTHLTVQRQYMRQGQHIHCPTPGPLSSPCPQHSEVSLRHLPAPSDARSTRVPNSDILTRFSSHRPAAEERGAPYCHISVAHPPGSPRKGSRPAVPAWAQGHVLLPRFQGGGSSPAGRGVPAVPSLFPCQHVVRTLGFTMTLL